MLRLVPNLSVGEAQRGQTRGHVGLVPSVVTRLLSRRAVVAESVGFHDEPEVRPVEVDLEPMEVALGLRCGKLGAADES